jgi:hypothetical protein
MDADPFPEVYAHMQEIFAVVLRAAAPFPRSVHSAAGRGHQPVNQPAAQESTGERSSGEISGAVYGSVPGEYSSHFDSAGTSNLGDVTPVSHRQENFICPQFVESYTTPRSTEDFVDITDVSGGVANHQVQKERDVASIQSSSSSKEVPSDLNLRIATKLREFQAMAKEIEDLMRTTKLSHPGQVVISDETKAQTDTTEEKSHIQEKNISCSKKDTCNLTNTKKDKTTVSRSQIKGHSDVKKTKFDANKVYTHSTLYMSEYWGWKLYSICHELEVMCENLSCVLQSILESFLLCGIAYPDYGRPYLHLAEVASLLIGVSSQLRSAVKCIMNNISVCNIKEIAHLIFAVKKLTTIFPLLETACRNLYSEFMQDHPPSCRHPDSCEGENWHREARSKLDIICHQMDVAYEQLEKAFWKINIIRNNEAAPSEFSLCSLQPETDSEQVDPKKMFFTIARKFLLIEEHISSLLKGRKFQGREQ